MSSTVRHSCPSIGVGAVVAHAFMDRVLRPSVGIGQRKIGAARGRTMPGYASHTPYVVKSKYKTDRNN